MNRNTRIVLAIVVLAAGAGYGWHRWQQVSAAPAAAPATPPSAAVSTVLPQQAQAPITVEGYGDLLPAKVESVNFARPGILAALRVVAGQHVRQGDAVAQLSADPAAEASYRQARSALTLAEGELQRMRSLFALQLATASQVQTAEKAAADARSNLDAQEKLGGAMPASEGRAPFDGVVLALNAAQGDRLAAGAPVLQIGRTDRLKLNLGVEPAQRQRIRQGQPVALAPLQSLAGSGSLAASPDAAAPPAQGRVASIQDMVDARTQLLNVTVEVSPQADAALVPGMRLRGAIQVGQQQGWKLPRSAVLSDEKGGYVFQVQQGKARRLAVQSLLETGADVVVDGPLAADRPVVSQGNYELTDGMAVRKARP
ncbi:efflux RND transporter periplasmic adaptor subunit [Xylophilus rhododendri]|uniref:Efflux RND transporter periplasmic adaptor subunit n=1 Tax=Xylophilus rhododendri TaxID=2697032 RepID=A0A857J8Z6_9BURK|nr:efflux RND transporter periplasmic adaptor subunit [Xylophilus rhododendri]QHJ00347.1 efflux RND transporter periplasmic adaptor subunit [Xylophilus rhododendri]